MSNNRLTSLALFGASLVAATILNRILRAQGKVLGLTDAEAALIISLAIVIVSRLGARSSRKDESPN